MRVPGDAARTLPRQRRTPRLSISDNRRRRLNSLSSLSCCAFRGLLTYGNQPAGGLPMSDAFLSSDDFDEQAHQLYNEGRYDEALAILNRGHHPLSSRRRASHRPGLRPPRPRGVRLGAAQLRSGTRSRSRSRRRPGGPGRDAAQARRPRRRHMRASSASSSSDFRTITSSCCRSAARSSAKA